jgi:hypothetical protein
MGLAHLNQAEEMHVILFGFLHACSLVLKRRCLVGRMRINHVTKMYHNNYLNINHS